MHLSIKPIDNVASVNNWKYSDFLYIYEGQSNIVYFQLVNAGIVPSRYDDITMRYLSQATSMGVSVLFPALDSTEEFEIIGAQPFTDDKSIWRLTIPSTQLPRSGAIKVKLTEDGVDKYFMVKNIVSTELLTIGSC